MRNDLVDRIYEAAFLPEFWPQVTDALATASGSVGGAVLVAGSRHPPRFAASQSTWLMVHTFCSGDTWQHNERPARWLRGQVEFLRDIDLTTSRELESDPMRGYLIGHGLGWQAGTFIPMPSGEVVIFAVDRRLRDGPHDRSVLPALNVLRPHLARAGLIAARLGLERAQGAVAAMEALGLPAVVMQAGGRVVASNSLAERSPDLFAWRGGDRIVLPTRAATEMLGQAVAEAGSDPGRLVRSIPVPAAEGRPGTVVHAIPLRRSAHDIFSGGDVMVVATVVGGGRTLSPEILTGLFDLTGAEARLASALGSGIALRDAAAGQAIAYRTARSYLERIFRKTGANSQTQLTTMLRGIPRRETGDRGQ